ncbi:unnamed protein product [Pieris macdunnoughi]|uniref:Uncharacterized protein n=1 Tax=Pieris macdunnoughi TaxID=345717 RepID=A0A821S7J6_9NEOP|nr:unnamed protein product [Pieris macdunnoughi]
MVGEKPNLLSSIENRRWKMIGHLPCDSNRKAGATRQLLETILEGKIGGRKGRGRPRIAYIVQIKAKAEVVTYQEVKTVTQNRTEWRLIHRQEPGS